MIASLKNTTIQICKPVSAKHEKGMLWFWNLAEAVEKHASPHRALKLPIMLSRSREFYNLYIQTGEPRYLALCEELLRHSLGKQAQQHVE